MEDGQKPNLKQDKTAMQLVRRLIRVVKATSLVNQKVAPLVRTGTPVFSSIEALEISHLVLEPFHLGWGEGGARNIILKSVS